MERDGGAASLPEVDIHDWPTVAYRATKIDMRHCALPTQVEANWQLDFLSRWKAKKHSIYSEGAIQLDGYPVLSPEGGFSEERIRRINTAILNQVGPNQDSLRHFHQAGRSGNGYSW